MGPNLLSRGPNSILGSQIQFPRGPNLISGTQIWFLGPTHLHIYQINVPPMLIWSHPLQCHLPPKVKFPWSLFKSTSPPPAKMCNTPLYKEYVKNGFPNWLIVDQKIILIEKHYQKSNGFIKITQPLIVLICNTIERHVLTQTPW